YRPGPGAGPASWLTSLARGATAARLRSPRPSRRIRLVQEIREGGTAPEVECLPQPTARARRITRCGGFAPLREQVFESFEIEFTRRHPKQIAGWTALDPIGAKQCAQTRDVAVERALGTRRRALSPESVDEVVTGDDLVRAQEQESKQRPLFRPAQRCPLAVDADLEPPEDRELHSLSQARLQRDFQVAATSPPHRRGGFPTTKRRSGWASGRRFSCSFCSRQW